MVTDQFARDNLPQAADLPDFVFTLPALHYPPRINCVTRFLDDHVAHGHGDAACLIGAAEQLSYGETLARVNRIANILVSQFGIAPGVRVLLRAPNTPMLAACMLAVIRIGAIAVPTMPMLRARELVYPMEKAQIALAICDVRLRDDMDAACAMVPGPVLYFGTDEFAAMLAGASDQFTAADTAIDDVCLIGFTSGTTGQPKGAMHFHRDLLAACDAYSANVLRPEASDRFIGSPPLGFTFGLGGMLLFALHAGASTVLLERAGPDDLLTAIPQYQASICISAPTAYRAMLGKLGLQGLPSLRKCVSAGETLPKATFDAWFVATGIKLLDGIGSTEMFHIFIGSSEDQARGGVTGQVVPGYEAQVVDAAGAQVPDGTAGRLAVRGPTGCKYMADPRQKTYVQNGWNLTGDTYIRDAEGYFSFQARSDDMIVSSGYNIAGPEVEAALLLHEAVAECAVIGWPDAERGMVVKAFVVLRPGYGEMTAALQDFAKATIAPYKYPRAIEYRTELPKTPTGKLQRFLLRQA
jgi:2-aminobenzoate-CoA ligase